MTGGSQAQQTIPPKPTRKADLTLEVVLLLIYGVFVLIYGRRSCPGSIRGPCPTARTARTGSSSSSSPSK